MSDERKILVVSHFERHDVGAAVELLQSHGITVVRDLDPASSSDDIELVLSLGGDGTFLRAAELARAADLPVLGINLGHVGFLAEWEADSLETALHAVAERNYRVEERMTLDVTVFDETGAVTDTGWALNECSLEKAQRRGVLDSILSVDGAPVSSFGCDGVIVSTPTGSTAYAFSAGGPILWPSLDAILVVPNNAHALFAKPLVVSPQSHVAVDTRKEAHAVCDGFRVLPVPERGRVEVCYGQQKVRWVRMDDSTFTDRLVTKFRLPVQGWRRPVPWAGPHNK
ncbi:NAD kinase [Corynebacterium pyruviciproducens]|uniref:NAD kinase n=3 Tax=Bacillati TaxID=1783272 RepID=S2Z0M7_9CORY|nr:NAD kinase [Corynebacterium pyruviciproducens]EPD70066.1 hypothetical protein HMPREF1219_00498 [Corynebacterium pyruviciproducens ATCC BAA-1742]MDH4659265.1 NAD kinase [Corynebacterium pyruviciproducens]MDK6566623.1 NAD kinase [Corynebacterium pyruviciproducens]MDK7214955.1 NAD kinase [Corynebacterium pyruviciproducens]WOT03440.1 NAD kinase [Corynebacterium pyruviciproducens]